MLFLYSLLFFALGTSVVALPVSPPTFHLSRRAPDVSDISGYWRNTQNKRVILIEDQIIKDAFPKLPKKAHEELQHFPAWERATKANVAEWKFLTKETRQKIPVRVHPSLANQGLMIRGIPEDDGSHLAWLEQNAAAGPTFGSHTHRLTLDENAIDQNGPCGYLTGTRII